MAIGISDVAAIGPDVLANAAAAFDHVADGAADLAPTTLDVAHIDRPALILAARSARARSEGETHPVGHP